MSFFGDILQSIGGESAPSPPKPKKPAEVPRKDSASDLSKPVAKLGINGGYTGTAGIKRKADEALQIQKDGGARAVTASKAPDPIRSANSSSSAALKSVPASNSPVPSQTAAKVPAKGSFADIMARAKARELEKGHNQVGQIKHVANVQKEKPSKIGERRRQEDEAKTRLKRPYRKTQKRQPRENPTIARNPSLVKSSFISPTTSTKPPRVAGPAYKGTMGTSSGSKRGKLSTRAGTGVPRRRADEYLGTDEEDNSELEDEDGEDFYSDESSDMEAGAFDIDEEEKNTLRAAKNEDLREAELERKLKLEKEDRKKKLQAMVNKGKK